LKTTDLRTAAAELERATPSLEHLIRLTFGVVAP